MGLIYPDNQNRANRVSQLATQIGTLQSRFSGLLDNIAKKDERTLETLDKVLKAAGFKTREEYIEAGLNRLTQEQREEFQKMRKEVQEFDQKLEIGMQVAGGLLSVAAFTGASVTVLKTLASLSMVRTSFTTMAIGLVNILKGNVQLGVSMLQTASTTITKVLDGAGLSEKFLTAMKYLKNTAKVLTVISVVLEGILLIYEAIEGARQKTELQNAIVELCARRFDVMKIDLSIIASDGFTDVVSGIISVQDSMNGLVADGLITQEAADGAVSKKIQDSISIIQDGMEVVTNDNAWQALKTLDDLSGDAWRNEDPSLDQILKWIEDNTDDSLTRLTEKS